MLSTTSRYAICALVELAGTEAGNRTLGHDLAASTGLPANYLAKILLTLRKAGIVDALRGTAGGYRLRRSPDEVTLLEVVELLDGSQRQATCLLRPGHACASGDPCTAHREWDRLRDHYLGFLEGTSVADLARRSEAPDPTAEDPGQNED